MPLEFRYDTMIVIRVDGDVIEIFTRGGFSHRFLTLGSTVDVVIKAEEEPLFRQFFTQVAQLCGRPVAP